MVTDSTKMKYKLIIAIFILSCFTFQSLYGLDNGLAKTPPMGWLAWVRFTCETNCSVYPNSCINDQLFENMADRLVADGYHSLGYEYINIDDCWSEMNRDKSNQRLVPDKKRFPNGIKVLADYIHEKGLKFGIYGDCGVKTCAGYPAQLKEEFNYEDNYFDIDSDTFSEWEIDSFKFDGCYIDPLKAERICPRMSKSLQSAKRPILLTCEWPFYLHRFNSSSEVDWPLVSSSCNLWRYYEDVEDSWISILSIVDFTVKLQSKIVEYHGPGHWFDPDQLVIGNFGLSLEQAYAQMAIWSIWSAPLFMSNDLRDIETDMANVLKNKNLINVNQDPLGVFGLMVAESKNRLMQAFVKPMKPIKNNCPSFAIVYLNRDALGNSRLVEFNLRNILLRAPIKVAAKRYNEIYDLRKPDGPFEASLCFERLTKAMTRDTSHLPSNLVLGAKATMEDTKVNYQLHDLIRDEALGAVALNSSLQLMVNPSGARAVKLVEI